jgi:titin
MYNTLIGNYMGTDASGMALLGSASCVNITKGAAHNRIEKNIISGSGREGVAISDNETTGNAIVGNYIGTNATGTATLGNKLFGIWIDFGASNNVIQQNLISGNSWAGVAITNWGCDYNVVIGNLIGTDASGTTALGNDGGVLVSLGSRFNRIGGTAAGERNVISGNHGWGNVWLGGRGGEGNFVIGNYIGTDISGIEAISVTPQGAAPQNGINLGGDDARHSFVGGMTEAERNIIAGNAGSGVNIGGSGVEYNFIAGNYIGTDASGRIAVSYE